LHIQDFGLIENIKAYFGVGTLRMRSRDNEVKSAIFSVRSVKELLGVIIPHFDRYPLITQKKIDFFFFKQIVAIISDKKHLTLEGLEEIVSLRMAMTKAIPESLKLNFPHIIQANPDLVSADLRPSRSEQ
jgi:hypothetical protein